MVKIPPPHSPKFTVDERFIVKAPFKSKYGGSTTVRILNAEGHIDIAHQIGMTYCKTIKLDRWIEKANLVSESTEETTISTEKESERGSTVVISGEKCDETRWAFAQVEVLVGGIIATGSATANSRDAWVKSPGMEVQVAETRAIKRALAIVCNITEREINPDMKEPTRDMVDMPFKPDRTIENEPEIPKEIQKTAPDTSEQFDPLEGQSGGYDF